MERLTLLVDSRSPWCYQASRWARRLEAMGELDLDFGLFSLELVNLKEHEDPRKMRAEYGPTARTASVVRAHEGSKKMGAFYSAVGKIMWEDAVPAEWKEKLIKHPPLEETSREALVAIGLDPSLVDEAIGDPATWDAVVEESHRWGEEKHAFGVPTMIYNDVAGEPAVFGPVIWELPDDATCLEMWRHVRGLVHHEGFFELKARRPTGERRWANLPNADWRANLRVRQMQEARPLIAPGGEFEGSSLDWAMCELLASGRATLS